MCILRWFFSNYYKRPRGLKKPYNPLLGEVFRCMYIMPAQGNIPETRCYVVCEQVCCLCLCGVTIQVSHHPPISAIVASNRRAGWVLHGTVKAGSRFLGDFVSFPIHGLGNTVDATCHGRLTLSLLARKEEYHISLPDYHVKGLLVGTMVTEFGGPCAIKCKSSGYT